MDKQLSDDVLSACDEIRRTADETVRAWQLFALQDFDADGIASIDAADTTRAKLEAIGAFFRSHPDFFEEFVGRHGIDDYDTDHFVWGIGQLVADWLDFAWLADMESVQETLMPSESRIRKKRAENLGDIADAKATAFNDADWWGICNSVNAATKGDPMLGGLEARILALALAHNRSLFEQFTDYVNDQTP